MSTQVYLRAMVESDRNDVVGLGDNTPEARAIEEQCFRRLMSNSNNISQMICLPGLRPIGRIFAESTYFKARPGEEGRCAHIYGVNVQYEMNQEMFYSILRQFINTTKMPYTSLQVTNVVRTYGHLFKAMGFRSGYVNADRGEMWVRDTYDPSPGP